MDRTVLLRSFALGLGLALFLGLTVTGSPAQAHPTAPAADLSALRPEDPVEVPGSALPDLAGAPIADLALYAFDGSAWSPIPFQIDERDGANTYVANEDGLLDANDVLVFMARDLGSTAGLAEWPADAQAQDANRQVIQTSDPLSGAAGTVYLYRSATLARSATSYVAWDQAGQTVTTPAYVAAFDPDTFIGLADLSLHGGPDVLDRQKIRVSGKVANVFPFSLNEEEVGEAVGIPATVTLTIQGPIRAMNGGSTLNVIFYRERFAFETVLDTTGLQLPGVIESLRTSLDLNDPATTGLTRFFDSNGSDVAIDGQNDSVAASPLFQWVQMSGAAAGPGGMVVAFPNLDLGGSSAVNYYKDDGAVDNADTGDKRSFADTGLTVNAPGSRTAITLAGLILPQGASANVGQSVFSRTVTPITVQVSALPYLDPSLLQELYVPLILR